MGATTVYSAANVNVNYGGHVFTGLGSGNDAIKVERAQDSMSMEIGMQGDATLSQTTDKSGTLTIKLLAGSETNTFLSLKANATDAGSVFSAPMVITEVGSSGKVTATKCVIKKIPDFGRGATASEVEWVFISGDVAITHAGSEEL